MRIVLTLPIGAEADALALALILPGVTLPGVTLRRASLRAKGARPLMMALQSKGRASYLFHGLTLADAADIAATVAAYGAAPGGWIDDARPCGRLRLCLLTRVPAA